MSPAVPDMISQGLETDILLTSCGDAGYQLRSFKHRHISGHAVPLHTTYSVWTYTMMPSQCCYHSDDLSRRKRALSSSPTTWRMSPFSMEPLTRLSSKSRRPPNRPARDAQPPSRTQTEKSLVYTSGPEPAELSAQ